MSGDGSDPSAEEAFLSILIVCECSHFLLLSFFESSFSRLLWISKARRAFAWSVDSPILERVELSWSKVEADGAGGMSSVGAGGRMHCAWRRCLNEFNSASSLSRAILASGIDPFPTAHKYWSRGFDKVNPLFVSWSPSTISNPSSLSFSCAASQKARMSSKQFVVLAFITMSVSSGERK